MQTDVVSSPAAELSIPDWKEIRVLCEYARPCISLYLGGHSKGSGSAPTSERIRRALPEIERFLFERGVSESDCAALLAPIAQMARSERSSAGHAGGLAVFRSPRGFAEMWLPWSLADLVVVESRCFIRPLCEMARANQKLFILALARKHVRLLESVGDHCSQLLLPPAVPLEIEALNARGQPADAFRNRSSAGPGVGDKEGVGFGSGAGHDKDYQKMHAFHKAIDRGLHAMLAACGHPLVVAGTEADVASYLKINTYKPTVARAVIGSPDGGLTDIELCKLARHASQDWLSDDESRALQRRERAPQGRISTESLEILRAAAAGRIMDLFVSAGGTRQCANVDEICDRTQLSGEFPGSNDDLSNAAMVETVRHYGQVWLLPPEHMPESVRMTAVFRY